MARRFNGLYHRLEIDDVTKTYFIKGYTGALAVSTERFTLYLTMVTYVLLGNRLTGDVVFSMAQLFNTVQLYMTIFFPLALSTYAEAKVTIKRLEEFLLLDENENIPISTNNDNIEKEKQGEIKIFNACASWLTNPAMDTLKNINLDIQPGTLCCVIGEVGAGKSSFLQMLIRELPIKCGTLDIIGNISYCSQEPWLFVSSVRDNILFGRPYVKNRYNNALKVCALEKDIEQFPFGDKTSVGEKGVSLSGGQRARINLARAIYSEADIYLLDDPLSAVDIHVGKHIFEKCIIKYLANKTRILVTHQLQFLKQADVIVVLNDGQIDNVGIYTDLSESILKSIEQPVEERGKEIQLELEKTERSQSITSIASSLGKEGEPEENQELIERGPIRLSTYVEYWRVGANKITLLCLMALLIVGQVVCNSCDFWIAIWTNMEELGNSKSSSTSPLLSNDNSISTVESIPEISFLNNTTANVLDLQLLANFSGINSSHRDTHLNEYQLRSRTLYLIIYTILIIGVLILTAARCLVFYKVCMKASKALHKNMFSNILRAPTRFFDTNPSGITQKEQYHIKQMDTDSENEISLTPPEVREATEIAPLNLLPEKIEKIIYDGV